MQRSGPDPNRPFGANIDLSLTAGPASRDVALGEGVSVVSTVWGNPAPVIKRLHDARARALRTVGSAASARRVVDLGVDAVVAQGAQAGGHVRSRIGTEVLTPSVVDALPVPGAISGAALNVAVLICSREIACILVNLMRRAGEHGVEPVLTAYAAAVVPPVLTVS